MRRRYGLGAALALVLVGGVQAVRVLSTGPHPVVRTVTVGLVPVMVAVDARSNRAFVVNLGDATVSVLDASTGTLLRTVSVPNTAPNTVVVSTRARRAFVLSDPHSPLVSVLDAANGTVLGTVAIPTLDAAVDEQTGHVFVDGDYSISMLDPRRGTVLHTETVQGSKTMGLAVDARTHRAFVTNFDDATVSVVDTARGRLLRTVSVGPQGSERPVAVAVDSATGRAFVTNNGAATVSMLDARSGTILRTITVGPYPAQVAVDERTGRVFVVHGRGGNRYFFPVDGPGGTTMLDARSGAVLCTVRVGATPRDDVVWGPSSTLAVDARHGRVFVINQPPAVHTGHAADGSVSVLDARSGRLREIIAVDRHPIALAVDEATARLFVVNTNSGCIRQASPWAVVPGPVRHWLPFLPQPPPATCNMPGSVTVIDTSRV